MAKEEYRKKFYYYACFGLDDIEPALTLGEFTDILNTAQDGLTSLVTVCLLEDSYGITARGISVMSEKDTYVTYIGEQDAERKAIRALKGRKDIGEHTDERALKVLYKTRCPYVLRGEKRPRLSEFEKRLLWKDGKSNRGEVTIKLKLNSACLNYSVETSRTKVFDESSRTIKEQQPQKVVVKCVGETSKDVNIGDALYFQRME